jgi:DNA polymerase III alpha subunit
MRLDQYSNPIFNQQDLFDAMYKGYTFNTSNTPIVDDEVEVTRLEEQLHFRFQRPTDDILTIEAFDATMQRDWFMPENYCPTLLHDLYRSCNTDAQRTRVSEELEAYVQHNMIDLLFYLKYLVDTLTENNILWGVGRGSSVASYVLFLIGVHDIDSMKYNLSWQEFLR